MRIEKRSAIDFLAASIATILALLNDYSNYDQSAAVLVVITACFFTIFAQSRNSPNDVILFICGLTLFVLPYLSETLFRGLDLKLIFYPLYMWVVVASRAVLPRPPEWPAIERWRPLEFSQLKVRMLAGSSSIALLLTMSIAGSVLWSPIFSAFYAIALVVFGRLCRNQNIHPSKIGGNLILFAMAMLVYILFLWGGFGRLTILTYLLMPIAVAVYYGRFIFRKTYISILVPIGIVYGAIFRGAEGVDKENFAGGSVSHALILQDELIRQAHRGADGGELVSQFCLMFLNWFPRFAWGNKPYGIGWTFVDTYLGRAGFSDGHSVSLGLWGEHLYLNPDLWLLSGWITATLFLLFCRRLYLMGNDFAVIALIFHCNVLTLFWGGMASFGSRVWWLIIPGALFIYADRILKKSAARD